MKPRKTITLAFFLLLLGIGYVSMHAAPVLSDENYSYHGDTKWQTDYTEARQTAASQDKPIVLYFWTTWCTYCEDYNQKHYQDPTVKAKLSEFVTVAVNLDSDAGKSTELQQRYNVNYPPQHVIITPDGEEILSIPGYAEKDDFIGYLDQAKRQANASDSR